MLKSILRPLLFGARGASYLAKVFLPASAKWPFIRAIFVSFVLLAGILTAGAPSYASWWGDEGGGQNVDPHDVDAPPGMQYYIRQVPVVLYDREAVKFDTEKSRYYLDSATLVWGELWSKDEWVKPDTRFGLNELYIPYNPDMRLAAASGKNMVAVPVDEKALKTAESRNLVTGLVRVHDSNMTWGGDAAPAVLMEMPVPSRESFLQQGVGVNQSLAQKYGAWLGAPVTASTGRQYYRAMNAYDHGALYFYSMFLNPGPSQNVNYDIAASISPYYDEDNPSGRGFYRGREWSVQLENKDPGSVPGLIGSITGWCNLKLTGPTEVTGTPGEEKELTFEVTSEVRVDVTTQVGTKREGQDRYQIAVDGLKLPAWGKAPVTLKFKVEDQPYTVRVKVNPNETLLEDDYSDNYVDVTVKPLELPLPSGDAELTLYAHSRGGQDIRGNYVPPEDRPPGTAKYADVIEATLKIPKPTPPRGHLLWWRVESATITYPRRNPDFTFGHPVEPVGTTTVDMKYSSGRLDPDTESVKATAEFEEDWSLAGAPIFDMLTNKMAPPPTEYAITAEYTVEYEYEYTVCDEDGCYTVQAKGSDSRTVGGKLLVNGTGINIL
ncbi:hypothetical protein MCACP_18050 [Neomoorella carbonis]